MNENMARNKYNTPVSSSILSGRWLISCLLYTSSVLYMADPEKEQQNLTMAEISPGRLLKGKIPRLIDEWQIAPKLWDAVRFEVDHRDEMGQFILTGSAVPASYEHIHHTGTGRFSWILMRPMSL